MSSIAAAVVVHTFFFSLLFIHINRMTEIVINAKQFHLLALKSSKLEFLSKSSRSCSSNYSNSIAIGWLFRRIRFFFVHFIVSRYLQRLHSFFVMQNSHHTNTQIRQYILFTIYHWVKPHWRGKRSLWNWGISQCNIREKRKNNHLMVKSACIYEKSEKKRQQIQP